MSSVVNGFKAERINLRASKEAKDLIQRAADLLGTTVSAFIISHAYEAAKKVVADQEILLLSDRDRDRFLTALENPPAPNEALRELLRTVPRRNLDCASQAPLHPGYAGCKQFYGV